jgi:hypothetical protein
MVLDIRFNRRVGRLIYHCGGTTNTLLHPNNPIKQEANRPDQPSGNQ